MIQQDLVFKKRLASMCTCLTDMHNLSCEHWGIHVSYYVKAGHLQTLGHDLRYYLHIFRIIAPLEHRVTILWQETAYRLCVCFRSKVTLMLWDQHLATKMPFGTRSAERAPFHPFFHALPLCFSFLSLDIFYQVYLLKDFRSLSSNNWLCFHL